MSSSPASPSSWSAPTPPPPIATPSSKKPAHSQRNSPPTAASPPCSPRSPAHSMTSPAPPAPSSSQPHPPPQPPELQQRIDDDLKRLSLVGKPLDMSWTAVDGSTVDLKSLRGKVVLIYFFATWSAPSMYALDWVRGLG